jgi:hypothetical protein
MYEKYTFFFKDGYYVTFPLTKLEFNGVKSEIIAKKDCVMLEDYVIMLSDLRYVAKQREVEPAESAVPEHMEQDVYEYIKDFDRRLKNGEVEEGY